MAKVSRKRGFIDAALQSVQGLFTREKRSDNVGVGPKVVLDSGSNDALFDDLRVRVEQAVARFHAGTLQDSDFIGEDGLNYGVGAAHVRHMMKRNSLHDPDFVLFRHFEASMGTILDVGANTGYSVVSMRAAGCNCPIVSFEVITAYKSVLEDLKQALPPGTYDYVMSGVGLGPEKLIFYAPVVNRLVNSALNTARPDALHQWFIENVINSARINFPAATQLEFAFHISTGTIDSLDTLLTTRKLDVSAERIAAIKIDVEGMEADVLAGGRETILRDLPFLILEGGNRDPKVAAVLDELGYRMAERHGESLVPAEGESSEVNGFFYHERHAAAYRARGLLVDS